MKIVFDGQIYGIQRAGGINRYFAEIITHLPPEWSPSVIGVADFGANAPAHKNLRVCQGPSFRPRRVSKMIRQLRWKNALSGIDLLHPTYYGLADGVELKSAKCPVIVTVYDMIYAHYAALLDNSAEVIRRQRAAVLRADHVVCISKSTESDLLERIPEATGKTSVVYLASSFEANSGANAASPAENPTFLFVGGRGTYKNFSFLLRVVAAVARTVKNLRLIVAGAPLAEHERWLAHRLGIADRLDVHVFPDEAKLQHLYRASLALLYPSLYEGFGIPPLEAMTCGVVAVTSNVTSLPEVMGDGGIMLDPNDENQWIDCMVQIARGGIDRNAIIQRGYTQAGRFSWRATVDQHVQLYRKIVADGRRA